MNSMKWIASISFVVLIIACGIVVGAQTIVTIKPSGSPSGEDTLYQVSTIDALAKGQFEGTEPVGNLKRQGDFGIGTFDALDGEMIIIDGNVYQVRYDGKVYPAGDGATTPFALVTTFNSDEKIPISGPVNFSTLSAELDRTMPSKNMIYAIRIHGTFPSVTVRSIPAQQRPYPTLAEAAKNQSVFTYNEINGTIVGYYLPDFMKGLNMPGYHLHFISDDRTRGGHLLDFSVRPGGSAELDLTPSLAATLPNTTAFRGADFSGDMSGDLASVER